MFKISPMSVLFELNGYYHQASGGEGGIFDEPLRKVGILERSYKNMGAIIKMRVVLQYLWYMFNFYPRPQSQRISANGSFSKQRNVSQPGWCPERIYKSYVRLYR